MKSRIIPRAFFRQNPITCARELIGAGLVWGSCAGTIVETEAYLAENDEACHTFSRPSTRAFVERNRPGAAYIYFSYGAHWMLNVLVKGTSAGFVLFRAVKPTQGLRLMKKRRGLNDERQLCSGPGKLTQAFAITNRHDEIDLCINPKHCFVYGDKNLEIVADQRIGISRSVHHPWRFTLRGSEFVSRAVRTETPGFKPQIPGKSQTAKHRK